MASREAFFALNKREKGRNVVLLPPAIIFSVWYLELQEVFCVQDVSQTKRLQKKMQNGKKKNLQRKDAKIWILQDLAEY